MRVQLAGVIEYIRGNKKFSRDDGKMLHGRLLACLMALRDAHMSVVAAEAEQGEGRTAAASARRKAVTRARNEVSSRAIDTRVTHSVA